MKRLLLFIVGPLACLLLILAARADWVTDGACYQCSSPTSWLCPAGQYVGATWWCSSYTQGCTPCEPANIACASAQPEDVCYYDGTQAYLVSSSTPTPEPWDEATPTPEPEEACQEFVGETLTGEGTGMVRRRDCSLRLDPLLLVASPCEADPALVGKRVPLRLVMTVTAANYMSGVCFLHGPGAAQLL